LPTILTLLTNAFECNTKKIDSVLSSTKPRRRGHTLYVGYIGAMSNGKSMDFEQSEKGHKF